MLICPILLYVCEIWEPYLDLNYDKWCENHIEKVHTQFLKILYQIVNNAVPNFDTIGSLAKFIFLLSQDDVVITRALAKYTFECSKIIENGNT